MLKKGDNQHQVAGDGALSASIKQLSKIYRKNWLKMSRRILGNGNTLLKGYIGKIFTEGKVRWKVSQERSIGMFEQIRLEEEL